MYRTRWINITKTYCCFRQHQTKLQYSVLASNAGVPITYSQTSNLKYKHKTIDKECQRNFTISHRYSSSGGLASYITTEAAPIKYCAQILESVHDVTGLPWWASIALTTITLRLCFTLPLQISSLRSSARLEKLQSEIKYNHMALNDDIKRAAKDGGWDKKKCKIQLNVNMKRLNKELYLRDNCHPLKTILSPWLQVPLWISMSFALRNLAGYLPVLKDVPILRPDLANEGVLWFSNLLLADSTLCLPITFGLLSLAITEMGALRTENPAKFQRYMTNFFRGFSICIVPIASIVPSCLAWYWTCSCGYGLIMNVLLTFPKVKRVFKIEKTPSEREHPFREMWAVAKKIYTFKKLRKNTSNSDKMESKQKSS